MRGNLSEKLSKLHITEEFAISALSQICNLGLQPTPEIYALWYSYYKNDDQDLVRTIDDIIVKNKTVKQEDFEQIVSHIKRDNLALHSFQYDISDVIKRTFENAGDISTNAKNLGNYIQDAAEQEHDPKAIITDILKQTRITLENNDNLTQKLYEQQVIVQKLQEEYKHIKEELITDNLTKVYNRRHLDEFLPKLIDKAKIHKKALSLLMFDIDHFKKFNDTHGHQIGDTVLKFVGHIMKKLFGDDENIHLFRYGGEEFTVVFYGLGKFESQKFSIQLMNAIAKKEIVIKDTQKNIGNVTISGGIAELGKNEKMHALIEHADISLYESKRNGRNQMTLSNF